MKYVIVNGWLELSEADGVPFDVLKSRLEVPNPEYTSAMRMGFSTAGMHRFDPLYEEGHDAVGDKVLYVPRALVTKYGRGKKVVDRTSSGLPVKFNLKVQLGPTESRSEDQTSFVNALVDALQKNGGAIGQAAPGYGKTLCSLAIAARLGVTTAVLVHKGFLMDQWVERITEALDVTPDEIGRVQQGVCDFKGKKIVLIMARYLLS